MEARDACTVIDKKVHQDVGWDFICDYVSGIYYASISWDQFA